MDKNAKLILGVVLGVGATYLIMYGGLVGNGRRMNKVGDLGGSEVGNGLLSGESSTGFRNKLSGGGGAGEIGNGFVETGGSIAHGVIGRGIGTILGIGAAMGAAYLLTSDLSGHAEGNG